MGELRQAGIASPSPWVIRGACGAVLLGLVFLGRAAASENLALHKPVRISSLLLGNPAGVVNGLVEWGSFAVHSRSQGEAWLEIDLEEKAPVGEVRIFGRGDGYYTDSRTPIGVEVSGNGRDFERVASCEPVVTQVAPCRARVDGVPARYVRLVHPSHLVLSEVEVYAAR